MKFKIYIEEYLKYSGRTQCDLAYHCDCAPASMNRYINKKRQMPLDVFMRLAEFLEVNPTDLYELYSEGGIANE